MRVKVKLISSALIICSFSMFFCDYKILNMTRNFAYKPYLKSNNGFNHIKRYGYSDIIHIIENCNNFNAQKFSLYEKNNDMIEVQGKFLGNISELDNFLSYLKLKSNFNDIRSIKIYRKTNKDLDTDLSLLFTKSK